MEKHQETFFGCDADYRDARIVIFGAPFDSTTSYRPGTRDASRVMRAEAYGLDAEEAREKLGERCGETMLRTETVGLRAAAGGILAETIISHENIPPYRRSIVDGYAVLSKDLAAAGEMIPSILKTAGEVQLGIDSTGLRVDPGSCIYVPTGGYVPDGADGIPVKTMTVDIDPVQAAGTPSRPPLCLFPAGRARTLRGQAKTFFRFRSMLPQPNRVLLLQSPRMVRFRQVELRPLILFIIYMSQAQCGRFANPLTAFKFLFLAALRAVQPKPIACCLLVWHHRPL